MTTVVARPGLRRRAPAREPDRRGGPPEQPDQSHDDALARARAGRILAERRLAIAIHQAESDYRQTEDLGREFERRLQRSKAFLRERGYLRRS